jgi:hypothetical protein
VNPTPITTTITITTTPAAAAGAVNMHVEPPRVGADVVHQAGLQGWGQFRRQLVDGQRALLGTDTCARQERVADPFSDVEAGIRGLVVGEGGRVELGVVRGEQAGGEVPLGFAPCEVPELGCPLEVLAGGGVGTGGHAVAVASRWASSRGRVEGGGGGGGGVPPVGILVVVMMVVGGLEGRGWGVEEASMFAAAGEDGGCHGGKRDMESRSWSRRGRMEELTTDG